jgi:hypothetical protein
MMVMVRRKSVNALKRLAENDRRSQRHGGEAATGVLDLLVPIVL